MQNSGVQMEQIEKDSTHWQFASAEREARVEPRSTISGRPLHISYPYKLLQPVSLTDIYIYIYTGLHVAPGPGARLASMPCCRCGPVAHHVVSAWRVGVSPLVQGAISITSSCFSFPPLVKDTPFLSPTLSLRYYQHKEKLKESLF